MSGVKTINKQTWWWKAVFEKKRLGGCVAPRASRVPSPVNMLGITATAPRSRGFFHIYSLWLLLQSYCGYEFIYIVMLQINQACSKLPWGRSDEMNIEYLVVALERREGLSSLDGLRISHPLDCLPRWHLISNIPCVSSYSLDISLFFENLFCVIIRDQPHVLHGDDRVEEQLKTLPVVRSREPEHGDWSVESSVHWMCL